MPPTYQIPVLQKAIRVLHAIADGNCETTAKSLARNLKIAPATGYRILQTFAHARWLNIRDDGRCELGLGLLPITRKMQQHPLLRPELSELLLRLTQLTQVTSKISIRDGDEAVTLLSVNSGQPMALAVQNGSRFHLAFGSSGAVFLSDLPDDEIKCFLKSTPASCWAHQSPADVMKRILQARQDGLTKDLGSFRPDVFGLSAPLRDHEGRIQGTITLTGLLHDSSEKHIKSWGTLLLKESARVNATFTTKARSRK